MLKNSIVLVLSTVFIFFYSCHEQHQVTCSYEKQTWRLGNGIVKIQYNAKSGEVKVFAADDSSHPFVTAALGPSATAPEFSQLPVNDWQSNRSLFIVTEDQIGYHLALVPGEPFVFLQPVVDQRDQCFLERIMLPQLHMSADSAVAFGTFGIASAADNPGSYSFMALVRPQTRQGVVSGWLTQERGSGLVFSGEKATPYLQPALDYGKWVPTAKTPLEIFVFADFRDARLGLERYAELIARDLDIALPSQPAYYCTWHHARASDEEKIIENAVFIDSTLEPYGLGVIQIDDRWQAGLLSNGPAKNFMQHRTDGPYPSGMAKTATAIRALGLAPGIWYMPFTGNTDDPFFFDKDYLFARQNGVSFRTRWGGDCFDLSHPKTLHYVQRVAGKLTGEWGYGYLKMDGLWTGLVARHVYINTGYVDDEYGNVELFNAQKTPVEAYRDGLKAIRKATGEEVFLSGCNAAQNMRTLGASFGLLDAMRVGADNGPSWQRFLRGIFSGSNLYFLHKRIWYNDPDPVHVGNKVPLQQARALVSWTALSGQVHGSSESYPDLSAERLDLLKKSMPAHNADSRPVDLFERQIPAIWLVSDSLSHPMRFVLGVFNWQQQDSLEFNVSLNELGLDGAYYCYDYWQQKRLENLSDSVTIKLPPASCSVLALRRIVDYPVVISTNRHVTQGIIDIKREEWSAAEARLQGQSELMPNTAYELFIALPADSTHRRVRNIITEPALTVSFDQKDQVLRAQFYSTKQQLVEWQINFKLDL